MKFISESIINQTIKNLEQNIKNYELAIDSFQKKQSVLFAYLFSDTFRMLTQKEREYQLYLSLVIWISVQSENKTEKFITKNELEEAEEKNYLLIPETPIKSFREKLDVFFKNYPQEDLLAFVEDTLDDKDEEILTKAAREPIFISLKSIIDCLCEVGE